MKQQDALSRGSARVLVALGLLVLAGAVLPVLLLIRSVTRDGADEEEFPRLGKVPEFVMTNQAGRTYGLHELLGKTWVASFMFTSCEGICPVMNRNLSRVHSEFRDNDHLRIVSFSVDPETDTPARLSEYAGTWHADPLRWNFLTAPVEQVHQLAFEGFKVGSGEDPLDHSAKLILVDEEGWICGYYDSQDSNEVLRLQHDLKKIL